MSGFPGYVFNAESLSVVNEQTSDPVADQAVCTITAPAAGLYRFEAALKCTSGTPTNQVDSDNYRLRLGTTNKVMIYFPVLSSAITAVPMLCTGQVRCDGTNDLTISAVGTGTTAIDVMGYLMITKIRD